MGEASVSGETSVLVGETSLLVCHASQKTDKPRTNEEAGTRKQEGITRKRNV